MIKKQPKDWPPEQKRKVVLEAETIDLSEQTPEKRQLILQWPAYPNTDTARSDGSPRMTGMPDDILPSWGNRRRVYEDARRRNPHRWSRSIHKWDDAEVVRLNPEHG